MNTSPPLATLLAHAADALAAVRAGRSLTDVLATVPVAVRPGTQALAFRALRGLGGAQALLRQLVGKTPPPWIEALLLASLALAWDETGSPPAPYAPHTLVDQAVEAAKRRSRAQSGFVNAVLRRFLREREALVAAALADPVARWNHPRWWLERVQQDWPEHWPVLLDAANRPAPMTLRVNRRRHSVRDYLQQLTDAGIAARAVALPGLPADGAIELAEPRAVQALPGFGEGAVSVQDLAAQQAAPLLSGAGAGHAALPAGAHVLDACAAPGGKTAHLLETAELDLLALDADPERLLKLRGTLERLGLSARLECADAGAPDAWWDGRLFDAILLDAPCTASGIVRRHPDVRWLRRPGDVAALAETQARLLVALWPLVKPGGRLLYATCSLFRAEGEQQIDAFLQRAPDACLRPCAGRLLGVPDNASQGLEDAPPPETDAFFYALLDKRLP
jgi:16S rRNA (cytosine967-C5)-methyltransferase